MPLKEKKLRPMFPERDQAAFLLLQLQKKTPNKNIHHICVYKSEICAAAVVVGEAGVLKRRLLGNTWKG